MVSPAIAEPRSPQDTAVPPRVAETLNVSRAMMARASGQFPTEKPSVGSSASPSPPPRISSLCEKIVAPPSCSLAPSQPLLQSEKVI